MSADDTTPLTTYYCYIVITVNDESTSVVKWINCINIPNVENSPPAESVT